MHRQLNTTLLGDALTRSGFNQSSLADALGVTRAAVSKWLVGKSFPRPPELLKLGKLLKLNYTEIVQSPVRSESEPLIAFRKRGNTKTTPLHVEDARERGYLLEPLVKYLPFDQFNSPSRLKGPSCGYDYLQRLVATLRRELQLTESGAIEFQDLIVKFKQLQAVLVPVMWGKKERHENALHIYLPRSNTTWIYLNLDSHLHDFKFWMAHELGHILGVVLLIAGDTEAAEDFSDAFAGALLFPEPAAAPVYERYRMATSGAARLKIVIDTAKAYVISPNSVYKELLRYCSTRRREDSFATLPNHILYPAISQFNAQFPSVSELLFDRKKPTADHFMRLGSETFKTPVFKALGEYLKISPRSETLVSRILSVPLPDAKEICLALA